jgi:hypothetical protein
MLVQALCAGPADGEALGMQSVRNTLLRCTILVKIKNGKGVMHGFGAQSDGCVSVDRAVQRRALVCNR